MLLQRELQEAQMALQRASEEGAQQRSRSTAKMYFDTLFYVQQRAANSSGECAVWRAACEV